MTSSGAPPKKASPLRLSRSLAATVLLVIAAVGGGLITLALSVSTIEFSSEVSVLGIGTSHSVLAKGVDEGATFYFTLTVVGI